MSAAVLTDFDGTIVTIDTGEVALQKFAKGDWQALDDAYVGGKISFEECVGGQFHMIKAAEEEVILEVEKVARLRLNFGRLVDYCNKHAVPVIVVSGGIDFIIRHFLDREGLLNKVEVVAPKATWTPEGIDLAFPHRFSPKAVNFKDDQVMLQKSQGKKVYFVGNGSGDFEAANVADVAFAVKGSTLAEMCRKGNVAHKEITDFQEVIEALEEDNSPVMGV